MLGKVTYEEIKLIDPVRFADLETTMRLLYDHSALSTKQQTVDYS